MSYRKILFVDRDGTLIKEPPDEQIDSLAKLDLVAGVIPALLTLAREGFQFVMVTNQDGLGTPSFPEASFREPHNKMVDLFASQGVVFLDTRICPHRPVDQCLCRKPHLALVRDFLVDGRLDLARSAVIGDRDSDLMLARNMGIAGFKLGDPETPVWPDIVRILLTQPRVGKVIRRTKETNVTVLVDLDGDGQARISTGIGYFNHMLEQLAKHGGLNLTVTVEGDLDVDEHHTVEDTALGIGEALSRALGDRVGIGRYGFSLPMDEARADGTLDLSGRPCLVFEGTFHRDAVGGLPTELVPHFYRSLALELGATIHLRVVGEDTHHMVESSFKCFARCLRQAVARDAKGGLPSTKGVL